MQLFSSHAVHEEGEHLAPYRVLAAGTGLGAGEKGSAEGLGWAEQGTSALCSLSTQGETHTRCSLWEAPGQGSQT